MVSLSNHEGAWRFVWASASVIPGPRSGTGIKRAGLGRVIRHPGRALSFNADILDPEVSSFCQELSGIFSCFLPTPKTSLILRPAACLWERVYTTSIQASVALEMSPAVVTRALRSTVALCARGFQITGSRWAGSRQARKRRRRMAARQITNLEDAAAMRRFPHPELVEGSTARRFGGRGNAHARRKAERALRPMARPRGGQPAKRVYGRERKETQFLDSYRSGG